VTWDHPLCQLWDHPEDPPTPAEKTFGWAFQAAGEENRSGGEEQLSEELIGQVVERVGPHRPDGHGEAWRRLVAEEGHFKEWLKQDLTVTKIGILLARRGVVVPPRTVARFAVECCGAGRRSVTVRVTDPPPAQECQVDFGRLGLVADGERRRVCQGLIFTACFSRRQFVWPTFSQTTEEVIRGFEAAWGYFGGVFPVIIPDNMKAIVITAENTAPRINDAFMEYAQSRGFVIDAARVATPTDKPRVERVAAQLLRRGGVRRPGRLPGAGRGLVCHHGRDAHPRHHPVPAHRSLSSRGAPPALAAALRTLRHADVVRSQGTPGLPTSKWTRPSTRCRTTWSERRCGPGVTRPRSRCT
jgi:transposase